MTNKSLIINNKSLIVTRTRTGGRVGDSVFWKATSLQPITIGDAVAVQIAEGYDPAGYGLTDFVSANVQGDVVATWACGANCD